MQKLFFLCYNEAYETEKRFTMEQQAYQNRPPYPQNARGNNFATASLICAVMAIMSCMIFYVTFFFGCFSILFAILSRQDGLRMPAASKLGLGISTLAIIAALGITAASFIFLMEHFGLDMLLHHPDQILEDLVEMMNEMTEMGGVVNESLL